MIGHPHALTLETLEAWLATPAAQAIDFVTTSTLADAVLASEPGLQASVIQASVIQAVNRGAE